MKTRADAPFVATLRALPAADRPAALRTLVVGEFRRVLMLMPHEALPTDQSFFDLGLTSLRIEEIKQSLEDTLARPVDADSLFNHPTVDHLLSHLMHGPLGDVFAPAVPAAPSAPAQATAVDGASEAALAQDLIARLMRGGS